MEFHVKAIHRFMTQLASPCRIKFEVQFNFHGGHLHFKLITSPTVGIRRR
jgi:hypothetical protein